MDDYVEYYNIDRLHFSLDTDNYEMPLMVFRSRRTTDETGQQRLDPLLFFKPAHPAFQARFRQTACSASHSNLWFTSPHTMSLMRSYVFSGFRYLSPMIRHVLTLRIACST